MSSVSLLKGVGYLVSTMSVILLGIVSWSSAAEHPVMLICLIGGLSASILGMMLRWVSHRREQKEKRLREESVAPAR